MQIYWPAYMEGFFFFFNCQKAAKKVGGLKGRGSSNKNTFSHDHI